MLPSRNRPGRGRTRAAILAVALPLSVLLLPGSPASGATVDCSTVAWMDQTRSPQWRARALFAASTLQQKYRWLVEQPANSPQQTTFAGVTYPVQVPCTPTVVYTDGPDGVRFTTGVTAFPAPIAVASTWDTRLQETKNAAQAAEAFDKRKNVVLGPGLAGGRTPLSGRTPEYLGEDPLLSGLLTAAAVRGLQEGNADKPVLADLKHFVANEQELDRQLSSSNVDERTLREVYTLPFEIAVERSRPESVMCSYNQINGVYACENPLLGDVLKDDIGFDGYVMSDFGAVHSTAPSLVNGLDQELNRPVWFTPARLDAALAAGDITLRQIDAAASRVVRAYIRGGLFDHPLPATAADDVSTAGHKAIARQAAEDGSVLLANDGLLPLKPNRGDAIALIGPTASSTVSGGISARSVCAMPWRFTNAETLTCEDLVAPEPAIRERAARVGAHVTVDNGADISAAAAAAARADVAVVFGYRRMGEFADLTDLHLEGNGDALVQAVAAANPNTVVVLQTGSAVEMPWLDDVRAVLETWYAGEQMGPAIAALLFGDANPSGKLPMTFPTSLADTPTAQSPQRYPGVFANGSTTRPPGSTEIRQVSYTERLQVGYRWYESQGIEPLFAFGHGLSYTTFRYSHLQVTPVKTKRATEVRIRFHVKNAGARTGTETTQAYVELPTRAGEPSKRLVGWQAVTLRPGQQRTVQITLTRRDLADLHLLQYWDAGADAWRTPRGTYTVHVGGSSDTLVRDTFVVR